MGKITFILGGVRSGKSAYAVKLAREANKKVAFIATCLPGDEEMNRRIKLHQQTRPNSWQVFEEPRDIVSLIKLKKIGSKFDVVIIDCLTLFVTNLMMDGLKDKTIENRIKKILNNLKSVKSEFIIVSNEVGLGVHPQTDLGRRFRDLAGRVNQITAAGCDLALFMVAGLPLKLKDSF